MVGNNTRKNVSTNNSSNDAAASTSDDVLATVSPSIYAIDLRDFPTLHRLVSSNLARVIIQDILCRSRYDRYGNPLPSEHLYVSHISG